MGSVHSGYVEGQETCGGVAAVVYHWVPLIPRVVEQHQPEQTMQAGNQNVHVGLQVLPLQQHVQWQHQLGNSISWEIMDASESMLH